MQRFSLFVLSLAAAAALHAQSGTLYVANLGPLPGATTSTSAATATILLSPGNANGLVSVVFDNLTSEEVTAHLTVGGTGSNGTFVFALATGQVSDLIWTFTPAGSFSSAALLSALQSGNLYVEIDTTTYPSGELGGKVLLGTGSQDFDPPAAPPPVNLNVVTQSDAARFLTQ